MNLTYNEAIQFLRDLQLFGAQPGLETTRRLAALSGNPQEQLRFIHVAGTNGKGSVCAMLESVYRTSGLRVGLFTSPHLVAFGERIQINRQMISESEVARLAGEVKQLVAQFPQDVHPTFFEVVTVMALNYFAREKCDLVIWETGLGGRLDATNIVTPLASVITNIQYDHQAWLGDTLEKIAAEKAGIIKPGVPVITAVSAPGAFNVIKDTAAKNRAPFFPVTETDTHLPPLREIQLPLAGAHQRLNAAVAVQTVRVLAATLPASDAQIIEGLSTVRWAGRLQAHRRENGTLMLLDGAHNLGGAETLRTALQIQFPGAKPTLIIGILRDKDVAGICEILAPLAGRIILTPVNSGRSSPTTELVEPCRLANPNADVREAANLDEALALCKNDEFVVVAGSLYLIGEALDLLKLSAATATDERSLNEWSGTPVKG